MFLSLIHIYLFAHRFDHAREFMPENGWRRARGRALIPLENMYIRSAYAARLYADEDVLRSDRRALPLLDADRCV